MFVFREVCPLRAVQLVLRRFQPHLDEQFAGVSTLLADHRHLGTFGGTEVLQHERGWVLTARRPAYPDADPLKFLGAQRVRH